MAEWLRSGLQIRAPRFDSGRGLQALQRLSLIRCLGRMLPGGSGDSEPEAQYAPAPLPAALVRRPPLRRSLPHHRRERARAGLCVRRDERAGSFDGLTEDEARRIAANIVKLPDLLLKEKLG